MLKNNAHIYNEKPIELNRLTDRIRFTFGKVAIDNIYLLPVSYTNETSVFNEKNINGMAFLRPL